jgi:hypothetical protein
LREKGRGKKRREGMVRKGSRKDIESVGRERKGEEGVKGKERGEE